MTTSVEKTVHRCDANKVQVGSVFSRHSHGEVLAIQNTMQGKTYSMRNEAGFEWVIRGEDILEHEFAFADQHDDEVKESRTKVIESLSDNRFTAMTICFNKKADHKDVAKALAEGQGDLSTRAWNKKVKDMMAGEERIMIGHSTGQFDEHQRLRFIEHGKGPRLVDTRTVRWLIVNRTRYVVKT